MDALECISTRRSIRNFRDIPVDLETMMTVIEGGTLAPNAGNLQDWKFILVTDKGLKKKISEYSLGQPYVNNAAFLVGNSNYIKVELLSNSFTLIDRKNDLQNFELKFRISTKGTTSFSEIL